MRAIWKGHIRFSLVTIPVRIYNAIETSESISFRQLHKDDNGLIAYDKRCRKCNQIVKHEDIVKGYEYESDQFVVIQPEDLEKIKLKSTRIIEIQGFVDEKEIHPTLFDVPYYAGPDGEVAAKAYSLLCKALKESGRIGVGKVVLRDRESVMLLSPKENGLLMYKLRHPEEIRSIKEVPLVNGAEIDKDQLKLAQTLVDSMKMKFNDLELTDQYKEAVKEMIHAKIEGKEVITMEEEERPVVDIMSALKASIDKAKSDKKPMAKATGKKDKAARASEAQSKAKKRKTA